LIEILRDVNINKVVYEVFGFPIHSLISCLIDFNALTNVPLLTLAELLDISFQFGWFDLLSQSNSNLPTLVDYLKGEKTSRKMSLLSKDRKEWNRYKTKIDALVPLIEYPSGVNSRIFFGEIEKKWEMQIIESQYIKEQRDNSLLMNLVVENIVRIFVIMNKTDQKDVLDYIRRIVALELKNEKTPILVLTTSLLELCEWHFYSPLDTVTCCHLKEGTQGELWFLNEFFLL